MALSSSEQYIDRHVHRQWKSWLAARYREHERVCFHWSIPESIIDKQRRKDCPFSQDRRMLASEQAACSTKSLISRSHKQKRTRCDIEDVDAWFDGIM
jgi:hypothetical protein